MRQERGKPDRLKMLKSHAQFTLMFSLEDLFCSVDDFCQGFESHWKQQLLGYGLKLRHRARSLSLSDLHDNSDWLSPVVLPQFQNLLSRESAD